LGKGSQKILTSRRRPILQEKTKRKTKNLKLKNAVEARYS